jgi:hypothetical protein
VHRSSRRTPCPPENRRYVASGPPWLVSLHFDCASWELNASRCDRPSHPISTIRLLTRCSENSGELSQALEFNADFRASAPVTVAPRKALRKNKELSFATGLSSACSASVRRATRAIALKYPPQPAFMPGSLPGCSRELVPNSIPRYRASEALRSLRNRRGAGSLTRAVRCWCVGTGPLYSTPVFIIVGVRSLMLSSLLEFSHSL